MRLSSLSLGHSHNSLTGLGTVAVMLPIECATFYDAQRLLSSSAQFCLRSDMTYADERFWIDELEPRQKRHGRLIPLRLLSKLALLVIEYSYWLTRWIG